MPPQNHMPGIKYTILRAKSLFLSKGETKGLASTWKNPTYKGIVWSFKNRSIMVEHTHVEI